MDAPASGVPLRVDVSALDRVLTNLVSNAIKFTEAGSVDVSVRPDGAGVRFSVRDTGIGISETFLPRLFDEFRQESEGVARSHEGSGLGLAITRQIVELMGGTIRVESELGEGSTFEVWLPSHEADMPPTAGDGAPHRLPEPA